MKLLLNIESLIPPVTGIGNYTFNLIEQLRNEDLEAIDCFSGSSFYSAQEALSNCINSSAHYKPNGSKSYFRNLLRDSTFAYRGREALRDMQLRMRTKQLRNHVYHEPNFILKAHAGPSVSTIHDLSFIHYPELHPRKRVEWISAQLPKTLERADFLITPSNIIREELIMDFGVDPDKVRAVYLGASESYRPRTAEQTQLILESHGLKHGRYILFVGTLEPRKGINILLDAWCRLPKILREEYPLVLAGAPGWQNNAMADRIKKLEITHGLRRLLYVPNSDLPAIYAGATVFAYPSLYEGFGLPVLEAMCCGVPVICTADTSMAEFTQGSVLQVARGDDEELASKLIDLVSNEPQRLAVANTGLLRSKDFSWHRFSQQTLEIYRLVSP